LHEHNSANLTPNIHLLCRIRCKIEKKKPKKPSQSATAIVFRLRRLVETPAQLKARRDRENLQRQIKIDQETPEEKTARLAAQAARRRILRKEEKARKGVTGDAIRRRIKIEQETSEEKQTRRTADAGRHREARPKIIGSAACMASHRPWPCAAASAAHNPKYHVSL